MIDDLSLGMGGGLTKSDLEVSFCCFYCFPVVHCVLGCCTEFGSFGTRS